MSPGRGPRTLPWSKMLLCWFTTRKSTSSLFPPYPKRTRALSHGTDLRVGTLRFDLEQWRVPKVQHLVWLQDSRTKGALIQWDTLAITSNSSRSIPEVSVEIKLEDIERLKKVSQKRKKTLAMPNAQSKPPQTKASTGHPTSTLPQCYLVTGSLSASTNIILATLIQVNFSLHWYTSPAPRKDGKPSEPSHQVEALSSDPTPSLAR